MAGGKQVDQPPGNFRRLDQGIDGSGHRIADPRLAQIAIPGAQVIGSIYRQDGRRDQPVERVVLGQAIGHRIQRPLDFRGMPHHGLRIGRDGQFKQEIVKRSNSRAAPFKLEREIIDDFKAEVFQRGHCVGKHQRAAAVIDFQPQAAGSIPVLSV